jgi:diguanylate cyclase (GGDEF)-like protein
LTTNHTHNVLNKIITLTNERDLVSLEYLLAESLVELISPADITLANSVKIYHAKNLDKHIFTTTDTERNAHGAKLSPSLKKALAACFKSGETCLMSSKSSEQATLYPLKNAKGQCTAVIAIHASIEDSNLKNTIAMVLHVYQNFAGIIRDNEHDSLTGLLNRKTFEYKIDKVLSIMHSTKMRKDDQKPKHYYLAIFDIDFFKKINDVHGHLIGDEVLVRFSRLMSDTFREKDMLFRYGGEEFIGLFECNSESDILVVLERLRLKISKFNFPQVGHITVSLGFTKIRPFDATLSIIDRADQALYYAKNHGRNQTCDYNQLLETGEIKEIINESEIEFF